MASSRMALSRLLPLAVMNPIAKERHIIKAMREKTGSVNPALVERIVLGEDYEINVPVREK